jgi:hypothetical protein
MSETIEKKPLALIDGAGESAMIYLFADADGDDETMLDWPEDWPDWVSRKFLEEKGFEVRHA